MPPGAVVSRKFCGKRLHLEAARSSAHWRLWVRGERYVPEIQLLRAVVRPGWRVLDVGANIGYLMLALSGLVGKDGEVACFEPDPDNLNELRRNVERNALSNVVVAPFAAGAASGRVRFRRGLNGTVDDQGDLEIRLVRLDESISDRVDLIKIDVEGFEGEVLLGAADLIDRFRPTLFVEVHPSLAPAWTHKRLVDWLQSRYSRLEAFDAVPAAQLAEKIRDRYLGLRAAERIDLEAALEECEAGSRNRVFWILARSAP